MEQTGKNKGFKDNSVFNGISYPYVILPFKVIRLRLNCSKIMVTMVVHKACPEDSKPTTGLAIYWLATNRWAFIVIQKKEPS
jgi:hypothetical protein